MKQYSYVIIDIIVLPGGDTPQHSDGGAINVLQGEDTLQHS
jgi:hypothetical protein